MLRSKVRYCCARARSTSRDFFAQDFGICSDILKAPPAPVLGVCLGCQGIGSLYGMDVRRAPGGAVHGRTSAVFHNEAQRGGGGLFAGIPDGFKVVRYHSLAICPRNPGSAPLDICFALRFVLCMGSVTTGSAWQPTEYPSRNLKQTGEPFPDDLELTAWTEDGVVMGLQHRKLPLWGVQFHPESICTEYGAEILANFIALADAHNAAQGAALEALYSNASTPPSRVPSSWLRDDSPYHGRSSSGGSSSSSISGGFAAQVRASTVTPHASCQAASAPACQRVRLKLVHRSAPSRLEAETFYMAKLAGDLKSFWLDSSRREHGVGRFSYMGGSDGPLSFQVTYNLPERRLSTEYPDGRKEQVRDCDVLEYLDQQLLACKLASGAADAQLPFEFVGGFVGYLGYELKELCEDGVGCKNKHVSEEPDAVLLFADRVLVWDHQEGMVHAVALVREQEQGADEQAAAEEWLAQTLREVQRLAALPVGDMLAERHKSMTETAPAARHAGTRRAPPAEGADAPGEDVGSAVLGVGMGAATVAVASPAEQPGMLMGEDRSGGDEPPTIDADDGEEPLPSITPAGPGSLSFPPVKPTAPSLATGPGCVPRGAMPQPDGSCVHPAKGGDACRRDDSGFVSADTEAQYQEKIGECLGYILEGESYELCLTTRHRSRSSMAVDALRFYQRLRAVNPAPYLALLRCGKRLTVCSSSPERFLRINAAGLCDSKPIKGTRRRGSCPQEDAAIADELRSCEKDLAENLMIVDLVRNDLGRVCTEASVCCPKLMDVETYATVRA